MAHKTLLYISLSGSDLSLPPNRYTDIGHEGDDVDWVHKIFGSLGVLSQICFEGVRPVLNEPLPDPSECDAVVLGGKLSFSERAASLAAKHDRVVEKVSNNWSAIVWDMRRSPIN